MGFRQDGVGFARIWGGCSMGWDGFSLLRRGWGLMCQRQKRSRLLDGALWAAEAVT